MQTKIDDYVDDVLTRFTEDITDHVFLMVENDPRLMAEYDKLTSGDENSQHTLNSALGRRIREHFALKNTGRCGSPKSRLIQSYEQHAKQ